MRLPDGARFDSSLLHKGRLFSIWFFRVFGRAVMARPFLARRPQKVKNMGAKHTKSQRVFFDYHLQDAEGNEFTLGVTALVTFGKRDSDYQRDMQTGQDEPDEVEAINVAWNNEKGVAGNLIRFWDLPEAMQEVIETKAIEKANEIAFT